MIKRIAKLSVLPAVAATVLLAAAPANAAGYRWSSCYEGRCDWGYVDGSFGTIWDQSEDAAGAALEVRMYGGGTDRVTTLNHDITERWFPYVIRQARVCEWDGFKLSSCGGWKSF
ncbi:MULTISPECIES: hypothetical protein [unclassified Streptomyces]|uniref:hypothetical protein n=1 Tax=unclassified Streptomyces TaxID=2593676 RepID=UPI00224EA374|nr:MULTISPECIES: hypothetical protein [unclassified Streptomyces]MCX4529633.1 hypothetical protein [Streptomyces sp. NBC_01551]MCX4539796.1 hypothetical protein [Streptomyces sp. NBC_01565]